MSLINKMLKDLEKRGVTPSMAFGNVKESTEESDAASISDVSQADHTEAAPSKKQPSRLIIYGGLFLAIYLAAYGWISYKGDNAIKQMVNPLQAQQYQPKAIKPLHEIGNPLPQRNQQLAMQQNNVETASATPSDIELEIKAAIEAEVSRANAANEAAIEEMLSEAETARQTAIQQALASEMAVAKPQKTAKIDQQVPVQQAVPKPVKAAKTQTKRKIAKAPIKPAVNTKPAAKVKPVKVAKANKANTKPAPKAPTIKTAKVASTPAPKVAKAKVIAKPAPVRTTTKAPTLSASAPKIVKKVRSEHQAEALYQKALRYVQQGRVSEAQTVLANALDIDPAHQDARQTLAALLLDNQRITAAKEVLQDGLVVTPHYLPFRMAVARLEVELGQPSLALDTLMKGKKQALNHAEYQAFIGTLLQGQGRHAEAITHFQNALNINRGMSNVLIGMGVSYQALNRLDDAKIVYQKAQSNTRLPNNLKDFLNYRIKEVDQKISAK